MEMNDGFQWSYKAAQMAKNENKFIWVGSDKPSFRFILIAIELWISDDVDIKNSVFNIKHRIAGNPGDISIALLNCEFSSIQIREVLGDCITKDNYNTDKNDEYLEELYRFKKVKSKIAKRNIPKDFKWSLDEATKVNDKNTFFRVLDNCKICSYIPLSHALRLWDSDDIESQNEIFSLDYRLSGNPLNITNLLKSNNYSDIEIKDIINNSITKNNYNSNKKIEYLQELANYRRFKRKKGRNSDNEEMPIKISSWTIEKFELSKLENNFIYISKDSNCYLTLSDAIKFWKNDDLEKQNIILNIEYRLMGTSEDVTNIFEYFGYPIGRIKKILKNSIDKDNFTKKILL